MARGRMAGMPKRAGSCHRVHVPRSRILRVVDEVAAETGFSRKDIMGDSKRKPLKEARWQAWLRLCGPNDSIASIARQWPCDHSSIIHALNKLEEREAAAHALQEAA